MQAVKVIKTVQQSPEANAQIAGAKKSDRATLSRDTYHPF